MSSHDRDDQAKTFSTTMGDLPVCDGSRTMMRWLEMGGAVPAGLAAHLSRCESCWSWASRIARVESALSLLAGHAMPAGVVGRANDRALGMLVRQLREGVQADDLRTAEAHVGPWVALEGKLARPASVAAAAMLILALRTGVNAGVHQVRDLTEPLAQAHLERHILDEDLLT